MMLARCSNSSPVPFKEVINDQELEIIIGQETGKQIVIGKNKN